MLTLAQKVYLASLARKEAAMPWEDDNSATPEILAGLGGAGATAGAIYGPRAYAKLQDKLIDKAIAKGFEHQKLTPAQIRFGVRNIRKEIANTALDAMSDKDLGVSRWFAKTIQGINNSHRNARKYDVALHKLFGKAGIKGKYSKAVAAAALASLVGGGASGIAHLLDD